MRVKKEDYVVENDDYITYRRNTGKLNSDYTIKHIYNYYIDKLKKESSKMPLNSDVTRLAYFQKRAKFNEICSNINDKLMLSVIENNEEIKLPSRCGVISVKKFLTKVRLDTEGNVIFKTLPIDYKATKELWMNDPEAKAANKKVYNLNEHYDGYRVRFHWNKSLCNFTNVHLIKLKIARQYKRYLAKCIKTGEYDYFELKTYRKVIIKDEQNR